MSRTFMLKLWRDMLAHKGQFLALILLVALGVTSYVGFIDAYLNLKTSADRCTSSWRSRTSR